MQRVSFLVVAVLLAAGAIAQAADPDCGAGAYNAANGHCYVVVSGEASYATWHQAQQSCSDVFGGHLAVITDGQENDFVCRLAAAVPSPGAVWFGASDESQEGDWQWVTGEAYSYSSWAGGEPNSWQGHDEDCVELYGADAENEVGRWNDAPCENVHQYACEYAPDAEVRVLSPDWERSVNYRLGQSYRLSGAPVFYADDLFDWGGWTTPAFPDVGASGVQWFYTLDLEDSAGGCWEQGTKYWFRATLEPTPGYKVVGFRLTDSTIPGAIGVNDSLRVFLDGAFTGESADTGGVSIPNSQAQLTNIYPTGWQVREMSVDGLQLTGPLEIAIAFEETCGAGGLTRPAVVVTEQRIAPLCSNSLVEVDEECDDGNVADGDGCSATCRLEDGATTTTTLPVTTTTLPTGNPGNPPTARFTTSGVVGFVGMPLGFDAFYSTDPENALVGYDWEFGDGSPHGHAQAMSRVYANAGTYDVTLTVTDAEGLTDTTGRQIQVLPADQIGLFNAYVDYSTTFDRARSAADKLVLSARLNIGDAMLVPGDTVALEIAGSRFAAVLDQDLRAVVQGVPTQKWQIGFGLRTSTFGEVDVRIKVKRATLGLGFNLLGALPGGDLAASVDVPVKLEIGSQSFLIAVPTDFRFTGSGMKARGDGASD